MIIKDKHQFLVDSIKDLKSEIVDLLKNRQQWLPILLTSDKHAKAEVLQAILNK